jgi:hypothetical protein
MDRAPESACKEMKTASGGQRNDIKSKRKDNEERRNMPQQMATAFVCTIKMNQIKHWYLHGVNHVLDIHETCSTLQMKAKV